MKWIIATTVILVMLLVSNTAFAQNHRGRRGPHKPQAVEINRHRTTGHASLSLSPCYTSRSETRFVVIIDFGRSPRHHGHHRHHRHHGHRDHRYHGPPRHHGHRDHGYRGRRWRSSHRY